MLHKLQKMTTRIADRFTPLPKEDLFSRIPDEVLLYIFSFLKPSQLIKNMRVNKRWRQLNGDHSLWKRICVESSITDKIGDAYQSYKLYHIPQSVGLQLLKQVGSQRPSSTLKITKNVSKNLANLLVGNFQVKSSCRYESFFGYNCEYLTIDILDLENSKKGWGRLTIAKPLSAEQGRSCCIIPINNHTILAYYPNTFVYVLDLKKKKKTYSCYLNTKSIAYRENAIYYSNGKKIMKKELNDNNPSTFLEVKEEIVKIGIDDHILWAELEGDKFLLKDFLNQESFEVYECDLPDHRDRASFLTGGRYYFISEKPNELSCREKLIFWDIKKKNRKVVWDIAKLLKDIKYKQLLLIPFGPILLGESPSTRQIFHIDLTSMLLKEIIPEHFYPITKPEHSKLLFDFDNSRVVLHSNFASSLSCDIKKTQIKIWDFKNSERDSVNATKRLAD